MIGLDPVEASAREGPARPFGEYGAIAAVSCAVLLFQVLMTRILSVTLSYHFAFLTISLAMFGLAAPGVWLSLRPPAPSALLTSLYASAVALPGAVLAIVHLGAVWRGHLLFVIAVILVPMLTLGTSICLLLLRARGQQIARMYAADLAGAALGALLAVPLLHGLSTPGVTAALGVLPLVAMILIHSTPRLAALVYGLALIGSVVWGAPYQLRYSRFYVEDRPPLYERWSTTARVTVFDRMNTQFLGWGMGGRFNGVRPASHLWLDQDGSAGTPILKYERGQPYPEHLAYDVVSAAYPIVSPRRACIIGGGGGRDILKALGGGATEVEVVEINPYIVDAVSRVFSAHSGDPYHLPGVRAFIGEGRHHFSRARIPCDVLEISQIDTFAASAAGAYALTENSLYTVEAIRTFWSHLSDGGVLSVSRWVAGPAWPESVRLVLLEVEALRREGIPEPRDHMIVLAADGTANVLLFRRPVTPQQLDLAVALAAARGFTMLWPLVPGHSGATELTRALVDGPAAMTERGYEVSPPTDDRPFFFQTLSILSGSSRLAEAGTEREQSVTLLRRLVAILAGLALVLVLLPLGARGSLPRGPGLGRSTLFFSCLGFGFMFVEIPLLQRLAVYLGHPSYATTVALGSLLVGAGFGASLAERVSASQRRVIAWLVPLLVGVVAFLLLWVAARTLDQPFAVRVTIAATALACAGAMMGMPFPLGMARFDDRDRSWYWAVNGATSVLASVLALVIALVAGFTVVIGCAIVAYSIAAMTLPGAPAGSAIPVTDTGAATLASEATMRGSPPRSVLQSSRLRTLLLGLPFALAGVLLFYSLRGIEWTTVWQIVAGASPTRLSLALMLASTALFLRACRWRILLNAVGTVTVADAFWATAAGYCGNNFLPARAGELVRTLIISSRTSLETAFVLATALAERILDAVALVLIGAVALFVLPSPPGWLADATGPVAILAFLGALAIVVLPRLGPRARALMARVAMPPSLLSRLSHILDQSLRGLRTLHAPSRLWQFLCLTAVIWCLDAIAAVVTGWAIGLRIPVPVAFLLIASLGLGSALPATPGYVGIYQFVAVTVLTPFGLGATDAIAYILVAQAAQYVVIGLWGAAGLWSYRLARRAK